MLIRRFISLPLILALSVVCAKSQVAPEPTTLVPGQPVEREIAGGESHTYQITLTAGQFVRFRLEQRAIDATLILTAPDGKQLVEMNLTGVGEQESLSLEAASAGSHRLTVRGSEVAALRGSYRLEAAVQATAQDRKRLAAEALLVEGNELKKQRTKTEEQVIEKLQQALTVWRELPDRYWEARTLNLIGDAHSSGSKYDEAVESYNQALAIRRAIRDRWGEGNTLEDLGSAYWWLHRYEKAIECSEQALAIHREVKNRAREGTTLNSLGVSYFALSRAEKAVEYFEQGLAIAREVKDRASEATALNGLGTSNGLLGRYEKAAAYFEQALAAYRAEKDRVSEGRTFNNLGIICRLLGRYEKGIEYFEQALVIARETKDRRTEGTTLTNLGLAYGSLGRHEKEIEFSEQALTIHREVKNRKSEGSTLTNLGIASESLGRYEKAIEYEEQALAIHREVKNRGYEGRTLSSLAHAHSLLGRYLKAIEYEEQALAIHREVKDRASEGETLASLGHVYRLLGRLDEAVRYHEQALLIAREIKSQADETNALKHLAIDERIRGKLARSRTLIEQSLGIAESLRSGVISQESRAGFLASVQDAYQLYTDVLMLQHQAEPTKGLNALAVEVSERQRARSLLDLLTEARTDLRQGVDAALIERERSLGKQLNDKAQLLTQANKPEQAAALRQEISQLENDYERAQSAIRKASPHYAALVQPQLLKLKEIQAQLDADTLLLEYALGEERSYLWSITRDSLTSYELAKGEQIKQSALAVYELLTARSASKRGETGLQRQERITQGEAKLPAAAQQLSQILLAPVAAQLGNKRLVIVADGALQYIPFAMLPEPQPETRRRGDTETRGQAADRRVAASPLPRVGLIPLILNHEVISLPSASALAIQRSELAGRQLATKMLAVIADPVFDRTDERFKSAAARTSDTQQAQTIASDDARSIEHLAENSADKSGVTTLRLVIPRLPFTRQEASQLMALAPKGSSFSAIDFHASRATVLDPALSQYRYVHIATHGWLDAERPGLSALVFSMVDAQGQPQNGFLRANDIYNLKLPAELVVLSACQTGLGKDIKGEGLVGLTRGFMYAGAARVVVSLWNVNDKATADLMTKFYEKMIKQGERPAAALRSAQVEMWKQKQWQSPYYWAAFTMQGEWR